MTVLNGVGPQNSDVLWSFLEVGILILPFNTDLSENFSLLQKNGRLTTYPSGT